MNARRVLFAMRNPEAARQPGLAKAVQVARALGASLDLFHAITDPIFVELMNIGDNTVDALRERVESEVRIPLTRHAAAARKHGIEVNCWVEWDYPPHEAVVRRALATGAELIIAECHKGTRTKPWLMHLTDWELLRTSPVPVLLIRNGKPYRRPLTLAAVDPAHAHAKPHNLDARILAEARDFSRSLGGSLHVVHANYPSIAGVGPAVHKTWSTLTFEELQDEERQAFETFRASVDVPRTRAHLVEGNPVKVIPRLASKLGAAIVVMGALSRSGLERVIIGNTAEKILGTLDCDVLVVKPEKFITRIEHDVRGIRVQVPSSSLGA
jgi:universal stress protein E